MLNFFFATIKKYLTPEQSMFTLLLYPIEFTIKIAFYKGCQMTPYLFNCITSCICITPKYRM